MSKVPFGAKRSDLLKFDPADLYIETNPQHPLYQRRAKEPPDEALVQSIMAEGVIVPILVIRGPDGKPWVEAGTRRTIAAREANKRLKAKRQEPKLVPAVYRDDKPNEGIGAKLIENALRQDLSISQRAEEVRLALKSGYQEEQIAVWLGCSVATIQNYRVLAQSHADVQKAVDEGTVRLNDAVRVLGRLAEDEQPAALKKLQRENPTRKAKKEERAKNGNGQAGEKKPVVLSPARRLRKLSDLLVESPQLVPVEVLPIFDWLRGATTDDQLKEAIPALAAVFVFDRKKKAKDEKAAAPAPQAAEEPTGDQATA